MIRFAGWAVSTLALAASGNALAARHAALDVQIAPVQAVVQGDSEVAVDVAVTNRSGQAVQVLKWQLPVGQLHGPLFKITKEDGSLARYVGPLVKRAAPRAQDYITIEAGATLNYRVALSDRYELGNGRHAIEYLASGRRGQESDIASKAAAHVWTAGRSARAAQAEALGGATTQAASITYTGACTASEQTALATAVVEATNYATAAHNYLLGISSGTQRYVKWFGTYTAGRESTVTTHFANEVDAFTTKPLTLDCSCNDSGVYAYVLSAQPYKIYLCGAFWSAPMTGTDSKAGTLVHEMSHFNVVAGTNDYAYSQSGAARLAKKNPDKAVDNADSHEYFAENNPYLP